MARVASNNNGNTALSVSTPFMDRLTHGVIKETSKSLRYYIDVKRRENAFILNPNSTAFDSVPLKARFIYGTTKEYPPLYASCHSDNDVKSYLRSFQQQSKQSYSASNSAEKQMCREELNFHMRTYKYSPRENQKFAELRLRPPVRSNSSCSGSNGRDLQQRFPKSAFKLTRHEKDQLIDDTADILATMVKTRRSAYQTNLLSQQTLPTYVSRNANPSPRQPDDQSNVQSIPPADSRLLPSLEQSKRQNITTENILAKAASIMRKAQPITKGLLCDYKVSVTTGNCNGASTDAPIHIKLYGTNGYTNFEGLVQSETHRVPFLKDQTDEFTIQTDHVGQLVGITIGHEQKDTRSSWYLNKISIDDTIRDITYDIPCNAWLSSKSNDQKTMRDFQVSSMISHKQQPDSDEHREETESQSDYSTTTSNATNPSQNDHSRTKKHRKQQHVSIGPTTVARKPTSIAAITNNLSQPPPATTVESHFNRDEFPPPPPPVPAHRKRSPIISSTSSSDSEIEGNVVNDSHSTTPTPSPTLDQSRIQSVSDRNGLQTTTTTEETHKRHSIDHERPPARLEIRSTPISVTSERPIKSQEETNENDAFSFFE